MPNVSKYHLARLRTCPTCVTSELLKASYSIHWDGYTGEIETALDVLETAGTPQKQITVLHCNTEYPTPTQDVNLRAMLCIREAFGVAVGYSDHTPGIEVPIAAVALGAAVIEKHFTLIAACLVPTTKLVWSLTN